MLVKLSKLSLPTLGVLSLLAACADETATLQPADSGVDANTPDTGSHDAGADVRRSRE